MRWDQEHLREGKKGTKCLLVLYKTRLNILLLKQTCQHTKSTHCYIFITRWPDSDSPHSEPGNIDEADNGTETHTSDEGQCVE